MRKLTRLIEGQSEITKGHDEIIRDLKANTLELTAWRADHAEAHKTLHALLAGHAEEMRELKVMARRQEKFAEAHERSIREHWREVRGLKGE